MPTRSVEGDGPSQSTMAFLAPVPASRGTAEDTHCISDEHRWTGPL